MHNGELATEGSPCPNCKGTMQLRDSAVVYGESYGFMYLCSRYPNCDTYVGCHKGTKTALGTPANFALRAARKKTHSLFDPLWRHGGWSRRDAYQRMEVILHIDSDHAHIAMLTVPECEKLCAAIRKRKF